jgi:membrane-associated phospholipid phosphatase
MSRLRGGAACPLLVSLLLATPAASADPYPPVPHDQSPYKLRWEIDAPLLAAGTALWLTPFFVFTGELAAPQCDPCNPDNVNWFDRHFIQYHSPGAGYAASAMMYALAPIFIGLELGDYGIRNWRGYLTDTVVVLEALAWQGTADEIFRRAVRRPRPYLYVPGVYPDARTTAEANLSFYSGHTSAIFAFAVTTGYTFTLRHPHSKWNWPLWIGLMALCVSEGMLRVASGDHFPTDVLVGAVAGASIGLLVPFLHRRHTFGPAKVAIMPSVTEGGGMVSLGGVF